MSMNIFRLAGDMSHVFSIIVLLLRLRVARNAQGTKESALPPPRDRAAAVDDSIPFLSHSSYQGYLSELTNSFWSFSLPDIWTCSPPFTAFTTPS